jgi:hypothetical protein
LFRIDRVLADAGDVRRSYLFEVVTESGRFVRSPALNAAIDGLSYGEDRSVSAVVSPTAAPARLNFVWSKAGTYVPVPEAQVTVSGTSDFRSLEVPPYRESVEVVCPSAACNSTARGEDDRLFVIAPSVSASAEFMTTPSTGDDAGSISFDNVFRTGTLTVSAERTGLMPSTKRWRWHRLVAMVLGWSWCRRHVRYPARFLLNPRPAPSC